MVHKTLKGAILLEHTPLVWTASPILEIIEGAKSQSYIIDAGCHRGKWKQTMNYLIGHDVKTVGVDIINHGCENLYDSFFEVALDVAEEKREAFLFAESAINSLYDRNEEHCYDGIWFFERAGTKKVETKRLDTILDSIGGVSEIHYIKIDCQGNDVNVAKGLGNYADITNYIQIESTFDDKNAYAVNRNYLDDIREMKEMGFVPVYYSICDHLHRPDLGGLPVEGEILFKRLAA